jgi:AcrR family transcriptional regulator
VAQRLAPEVRREEILAAALDASVTVGAVGTFIDDVCRGAGVSVGTVYHHFGSKERLLAALHLSVLNRYQAGAAPILVRDPSAETGIKETVTYHLRWLAGHPKEATFLLQQPYVGRHVELAPTELIAENDAFLAIVHGWLERHTESGELRPLPFATVVALLIGPIHHWIRAALHEGHVDEVESVIDQLADGTWQALRAPLNHWRA